jgi:hypothetical protein
MCLLLIFFNQGSCRKRWKIINILKYTSTKFVGPVFCLTQGKIRPRDIEFCLKSLLFEFQTFDVKSNLCFKEAA